MLHEADKKLWAILVTINTQSLLCYQLNHSKAFSLELVMNL